MNAFIKDHKHAFSLMVIVAHTFLTMHLYHVAMDNLGNQPLLIPMAYIGIVILFSVMPLISEAAVKNKNMLLAQLQG